MALLALQSLANSSSLKSIEDDDAHSIAHSGVSVLSHVNTPPGKSGFMSVLCEHDLTQWMQAKIIHNQERPQFDQALQYPDMLYAVVSGMVQIYAQILLPTQADGNTGQPLPPAECQLTHDGQARVTVVFWAELQWQDQAVTLEEIIDSLPGDNTYMFMGSRPARWMSNPSDTDHDTAPGR
jgi:hypothetical protein